MASLAGCGAPATSAVERPVATTTEAPVEPVAARLTVALSPVVVDEIDPPRTLLRLTLTQGDQVTERELGPIPECCDTVITHGDDLATFEGWYAGGGHRVRIRREGDAIVVHQVLFGEGMDVPTDCDIRGDELLRLPVVGPLTIEAPTPTERTAALPDCTAAQLAALVNEGGD
jgi:hypothetical protein